MKMMMKNRQRAGNGIKRERRSLIMDHGKDLCSPNDSFNCRQDRMMINESKDRKLLMMDWDHF